MSGNLKSEISPKNKYWISKKRYLELKNYCLQYDEWVSDLGKLNFYPEKCHLYYSTRTNEAPDPTFALMNLKDRLMRDINLVEECCMAADEQLAKFIFWGVTRSLSYAHLKAKYDIPCGKDLYYDRYRKFFWILSQKR